MSVAQAKSDPKIFSVADMMTAIFEMQPRLRERAQEAKELRRVPQASIDELQDIGFFLALQPKRYGGLELTPQDFFRMQIALAEGCMSTAWACGIIAVHAFQLAIMDDRAQQAIWGDNIHTRVSSSYAPMGKVTAVDGGFKLSGRWGWSSGSDHCTWALLGAIIPGDGYRTFLVPKSDYKIIDTWQSMGLQGTGSNDVAVDDVFVPDYMTHKQTDGFACTNPGQALNTAPLYQLPWAQTFIRVVCTPAIGACKAAIELYKHAVLNKASGDPTKLAGDTQVQERIAAAVNGIDEMEALLFGNFDTMMAMAEAGQAIPVEDRARYRYHASLVITKSIGIIDSLFEVAGGQSVFLGSEIQQRFLDIHTARAHVANNPTSFARNLGGLGLGIDNGDYFL
ncbi:MAG: 3-hydroxy-9,10-secoandrosta-1,3,5(10)-triene-9,17-dione monooxygenase [Zhongshania sp.]|jgi:3-hydroxy-9,10-secoandrosta-1,3,5(10)-triene-9,17-dione monooxygenase